VKRAAIALVLACGGGGVGNAPKLLRSAIEAKQDSLDGCYGNTLEKSADAAGKMSLLIKVKGGAIVDVDIKSSEIEDPKLDKCIKTTIKKVKLEGASDADFDIEYTVQFKVGES
jgi:hypothetical protein